MLTSLHARVAPIAMALAFTGLAAASDAQPAAAPLAAAAQPAPSAAEIVARYVAWRGGAAFERLGSIHIGLSLAAPSGRQLRQVWLERDGRSRVETDLESGEPGSAGLRLISVVGPDGAWDENISGQVIQDPAAREAARRYALLAFSDALLGQRGAAARLSGVAKVEGRSWPMVNVELDDGDADYAVIDPNSGQLWTLVTIHRGVETTQAFGDWRVVDGVRMPFYWLQQTAGEQRNPTVESIELNQRLDPALFRKPAGARLATFAGDASSSGWIDFEPADARAIYLPVRVNGHAASALLDTGASTSVVDRRRAAALGLKPVGPGPMTAMGSRAGSAEFVSGVSLQAGRLRLTGVTAATSDLGALGRAAGHPLSAIIGREAFNELVVDLDFARRRVAFVEPADFVPPAGAIALPLGPEGTLVSIDGRPPALFQVDLGYTWSVEVFPAYVKSQKLPAGRQISDALVRGLGGEIIGRVRLLRELAFAGLRFADVPATFVERQPPAVGPDVGGMIGIGLLSRFRVILDYPQGRLYLVPAPDAATRPFERTPVEGFADPDPLTNPSPCKPSPGTANQVC